MNKTRITVWLLLLTLSMAGETASLPLGFTAEYEVKRNGIYLGISQNTLKKRDDGLWEYRAEVEPRGFLALFIADHVSDVTTFKLINERIQPQHYLHHHQKKNEDAVDELTFDWSKNLVQVSRHPKPLEVSAFTQDVLSFQLDLMMKSQLKIESHKMPIANRRGIEIYDLQYKGPEEIEVPYGKFTAHRFEALDQDNDRHLLWLVKELNFFPVKLQNIDSDGVVVDIELQTLNINK